MMPSKIEWTEQTWNPVTGCTPVSEGCANCYARRQAKRLQAMGVPKYRDGFAVRFHLGSLKEPSRWRKPRMVFVCSMGDLFHEDVNYLTLDNVFAVMEECPHHTFQVLTKRPEAMAAYILGMWEASAAPNIWLGTSVETQDHDDRIADLLRCPAAVRFLSLEPLLGPMDISSTLYAPHERGPLTTGIDWVIVGCESRGGHLGRLGLDGQQDEARWWNWVADLARQCDAAQVPLFVKQGPVGGQLCKDANQFPQGLRRREWPDAE